MSGDPAEIVLSLARTDQLVEAREPSPFRDGDRLVPEAADYIVRRARALRRAAAFRIEVTLPAAAPEDAPRIAQAIHAHFARRAEEEDKAMADHMADGWQAAAIGLVVFGICLAIAWRLYAHLADYPFARIVRESFVILGWVALWKPIELLLHERLPIARRRRLYRRLAAAEVTVRPASGASA